MNRRTFAQFGFFAYCLLSPLYVFPSGLPQPGDITFGVFSLLFFASVGLAAPPSDRPMMKFGFMFVFYITVSSLIWSMLLSSTVAAKVPLFYIFNFTIILYLSKLRQLDRQKFLKTLWTGILLAIGSSVLLLLSGLDLFQSRQTGGFNNPNQLGYFGLLCLCVVLALRGMKVGKPLTFALGVGGCLLQIAISFSLASTASAFVALLGGALMTGRKAVVSLIFMTVFLALSVIVMKDTQLGKYIDRKWNLRAQKIERKIDTIGRRGYDRLLDYPEYLVFGASEGDFGRFGGLEFHSTLGTVLFCYGIPGLTLFIVILWKCLVHRSIPLLLVGAAPILYSFTHQGMRFTYFWIFLYVMWMCHTEYFKHSQSNMIRQPIPNRRRQQFQF